MTTPECYRQSSREYMNEIKDIIKGIDMEPQHMVIGGVEFEITDHGNIFFHTGTASGFIREEGGELIPQYFICQEGHIRYTYHDGNETVSFLSKYREVDYHTTV